MTVLDRAATMTAAVVPAAGPSRSRAALVLALVVAVGAGVPVALELARGVWDVPMNDEWGYARDAFTLHDQHRFAFWGWGEMSKVGMLVAVQPFLWVFGDTVAAVHAFGVACFAVFVVATYCLVAGFAGRARGLGAAAVIGLSPELPALIPSFLTDVPMLAAAAVSAALGARALRTPGTARYAWLLASLVLGFVSFSTREVGAVAPGAVLLAVAVKAFRSREWSRAVVVGSAVAGAGALLLFEHWRHDISGDQPPKPLDDPLGPVAMVGWTLAALGVLALPVLVVLTASGRLRIRLGPLSAVLVGIWALDVYLAVVVLHVPPLPGVDYLDPRGAGTAASLFGYRRSSSLEVLLIALQVPAVLGGLALVGHLQERLSRWREHRAATVPGDVLMLRFLVLLVVVVEIPVLSSHWNDRYCLPLAWVAVVVLLVRAAPLPRNAVLAGGLAVGLLLPFGWFFADQGFRFHAATWRTGQALVAMGYAPTDVDAGLEWTGWHSPVAADGAVYWTPPPHNSVPLYLRMYTHQPCVTLSLDTTIQHGGRLLASYPWTDAFGNHKEMNVFEWMSCPGTPLTP